MLAKEAQESNLGLGDGSDLTPVGRPQLSQIMGGYDGNENGGYQINNKFELFHN